MPKFAAATPLIDLQITLAIVKLRIHSNAKPCQHAAFTKCMGCREGGWQVFDKEKWHSLKLKPRQHRTVVLSDSFRGGTTSNHTPHARLGRPAYRYADRRPRELRASAGVAGLQPNRSSKPTAMRTSSSLPDASRSLAVRILSSMPVRTASAPRSSAHCITSD